MHRLELPLDAATDLLALLEENGLIIETADDPPAYIPSRDIERITLKEVFSSVRIAGKETFRIEDRLVSVPEIDNIMQALDNARDDTLNEKTLKGMVLSSQNPGSAEEH